MLWPECVMSFIVDSTRQISIKDGMRSETMQNLSENGIARP